MSAGAVPAGRLDRVNWKVSEQLPELRESVQT
jgi:hypothetical protein